MLHHYLLCTKAPLDSQKQEHSTTSRSFALFCTIWDPVYKHAESDTQNPDDKPVNEFIITPTLPGKGLLLATDDNKLWHLSSTCGFFVKGKIVRFDLKSVFDNKKISIQKQHLTVTPDMTKIIKFQQITIIFMI